MTTINPPKPRAESMNKNSKYRELLDDVHNQILKAEIGVTGVFQVMMETLGTAEKEELAMKEELDAANARIKLILGKINSAQLSTSDLAMAALVDEAIEIVRHG